MTNKIKKLYCSPRKDGKWDVKRKDAKRALKIYSNQEQAWKETRALAKKERGEAYLFNENGRIREANSYGNDPFPLEDGELTRIVGRA